uniref:acetyl-CoA C-acyltransferase n=1 Tax=Heterosigma akashiwo TaxID=2829 RepID=A0A6V1SKD4_HETAK
MSQQQQRREVVVVEAVRTAITRAKKGSFKDSTPDDLLAAVFTAALERSNVDATVVQDICVGNVLQTGSGVVSGRIAQLQANIPPEVPFYVVNRQCSSGLQAVANIAASIRDGEIDCGIAAGVETMSRNAMTQKGLDINMDKVLGAPRAAACLIPMGITSENVAAAYGVSRRTQDEFAARSHALAAAAQYAGMFREEIVPVEAQIKGPDGTVSKVLVDTDEGIRAETTADKLSALRPAFKEGGSTTAGNASQVSDGAAAVLLMSADRARALGKRPLGKMLSYAVVGVPPEVMGVGPAFAIPEALRRAGLAAGDVDVFEINEAFASQATYCVQHLGLPAEKVNPLGGAIALGHPLGCTGARQVATLLHHLRRTGKRYGVVSMCIGTGMGAAAVFEADLDMDTLRARL